MASSSYSPTRPVGLLEQADALMRKNWCQQKRSFGTIMRLLAFPIIMCFVIAQVQTMYTKMEDKNEDKKWCQCDCSTPEVITEECDSQCLSRLMADTTICPTRKPRKWPLPLQLPEELRVICKSTQSCPAVVLLTGDNRSVVEGLGKNLFPPNTYSASLGIEDRLRIAENLILATDTKPLVTYGFEMAFFGTVPLVTVQTNCSPNVNLSLGTGEYGRKRLPQDLECLRVQPLWRDNSSIVTTELVNILQGESADGTRDVILGAYDFLNTDNHNFNTTVWYNQTDLSSEFSEHLITRVQKALNLATNSYLRFLRGAHVKVIFEFVAEMPKPLSVASMYDMASLTGPLLYAWVFQLPFPVILNNLVYEKQHKLRIMMKMHGLRDSSYWLITYSYFFVISSVYMTCFLLFGTIVGLKSFTLNSYIIQFIFFLNFMNLQIAFAFLLATFFADVKTSSVIGFLYVFASSLLGYFIFVAVLKKSESEMHILLLQIFPFFALFRGLYELGQYSFDAQMAGGAGMLWGDLGESGLSSVLITMMIEWMVLLLLAYYLDQVFTVGGGVNKHPLWFLNCKFSTCSCTPLDDPQRKGFDVLVNVEKPDVYREKEVAEKLMQEPFSSNGYPMIVDRLQKVYSSKDGNPEVYAVREISIALREGECLGVIGPNGAGKTSFINMMIGLTNATAGNALVNGFDIRNEMDLVYCSMGVCPQHNLLWEMLTAREHLTFYGRLKNLRGYRLEQAVDASLEGVNLFNDADRLAGKLSGGTRRRLSVAISTLGNPKVIYLDEPSTGLDPASRDLLWRAIKREKQGKAIILTTHSMAEAEALCNRIGIFVDGKLQCLGTPSELKARYGGIYLLTITTSSAHEEEVKELAHSLSPNAKTVYQVSGTYKFELPKQDVRIATVFQTIADAKNKFTVQAWGLTETTLEDVFIKVAKGLQHQ